MESPDLPEQVGTPAPPSVPAESCPKIGPKLLFWAFSDTYEKEAWADGKAETRNTAAGALVGWRPWASAIRSEVPGDTRGGVH